MAGSKGLSWSVFVPAPAPPFKTKKKSDNGEVPDQSRDHTPHSGRRRRPRALGASLHDRIASPAGASSTPYMSQVRGTPGLWNEAPRSLTRGTPMRGLRQPHDAHDHGRTPSATPRHTPAALRDTTMTPDTVRFGGLSGVMGSEGPGGLPAASPTAAAVATPAASDLDRDWSDAWVTVIGHPVGREMDVEQLFRRVGRIEQAVKRGNQLHLQFSTREERDRAMALHKREGLLVPGQALAVTVCREDDIIQRPSPGNYSMGPAVTLGGRTPSSRHDRGPLPPSGSSRTSLHLRGGSSLRLRELQASGVSGTPASQASMVLGRSRHRRRSGAGRDDYAEGFDEEEEEDLDGPETSWRLGKRNMDSYKRDKYSVRGDNSCCGWIARLCDFLVNF